MILNTVSHFHRVTFRQLAQTTFCLPSGLLCDACTSLPWCSKKAIAACVLQNRRYVSSDITLQYKGRVFRVPQLTGWLVLVSGDILIEDLRKAPGRLVSGEQAQLEVRKLTLANVPG